MRRRRRHKITLEAVGFGNILLESSSHAVTVLLELRHNLYRLREQFPGKYANQLILQVGMMGQPVY